MKEIPGGVCAPKGFMAGGIRCGIKAASDKKDLALICSQKPCTAAAVFTTNLVQAACVLVTKEHIEGGTLQAIIANSGNANACTGGAGLAAARRMAELAAGKLAIDVRKVAVASTGVIGVPLPIDAIENGMDALADSLTDGQAGHAAALDAIMTTDTRRKEVSVEIEIGGVPVRIGGMAKGAGMIHPNMATMLCFLTTDAAIPRETLDMLLRRATRLSFNRLSIDGDTSTNDMVVIMANGASGIPPLADGSVELDVFARALDGVCVALTRAIARDGEGASRMVTVTVSGAADEEGAELLAKSIASSSLVKTACFGADANWGRILCAMGYSGARFDPARTGVRFKSDAGEIAVYADGTPIPFCEDEAKKILSRDEIEILVDVGNTGVNGAEATVWGCDLTYDYVKINGDYRS